jgi:hypothetical protein
MVHNYSALASNDVAVLPFGAQMITPHENALVLFARAQYAAQNGFNVRAWVFAWQAYQLIRGPVRR